MRLRAPRDGCFRGFSMRDLSLWPAWSPVMMAGSYAKLLSTPPLVVAALARKCSVRLAIFWHQTRSIVVHLGNYRSSDHDDKHSYACNRTPIINRTRHARRSPCFAL